MKGDYLWDRTGEPDPDIQELERRLAALRCGRPAPDFTGIPESQPVPRWYGRFRLPVQGHPARIALALISLTLIVAATAWWYLEGRPSYEIERINGSPTVGASPIGETGRLRVGQWLETDAASRARIQVGGIGEVEIGPNTRIGLIQARASEHRLSLKRGVMHALIWAPPGLFFVNTPSAQAVDLGCAYTLEIDDDGTGLLRVTAGWVAFERDGRESFVPAGAVCLTRPSAGPGTPHQDDSSPAFRAALEHLDFRPADAVGRAAALSALLSEARREDALTLWHLLVRGDDVERFRVYVRLAELIPPPRGVTSDGVLARNQQMLDLWWNQLGLGSTDWWRHWKRAWPGSR